MTMIMTMIMTTIMIIDSEVLIRITTMSVTVTIQKAG